MYKKLIKKIAKLPERSAQFLSYLYYQKFTFGITNTKFDISFIVFRESFLNDNYRIKEFATTVSPAGSLPFIDVGRNHGLVFFYFLQHVKKQGLKFRKIDYIGLDPSPLKFVYDPTPPAGCDISYRIIDKAVVFDKSPTVKLKYGERNIGNFNVSGSNFEKDMSKMARKFEFIEIEVDTLSVDDLMDFVRAHENYDATVVKIDCKNRTEIIMQLAMDVLKERATPYLVACESDGSSEGALAETARKHEGTFVFSRT